jgi:two-component system chemotaxis response regulator CheY
MDPATCRILLVEDDPATRTSLALILRLAGYAVDTAGHGAEALDRLLRGAPPCLIFLDLTMPVMDGWEFLRRRQEIPALSEIPVAVVSALGDLRGEALLGLGVSGVFRKPADPADLLGEIVRH